MSLPQPGPEILRRYRPAIINYLADCLSRRLPFQQGLLARMIRYHLGFESSSGQPAGGPEGKDLFSLSNTFAETMLLLFSSITFGFATLAMRAGHRRALLAWMFVTVALGLTFVTLEFREFSGMVAVGAGPDRSGFLSAFFTLVGMHGLHVSFGLIWILIMASEVVVKGLTVPVVSRLSRLALFWHFLDIIWVAIFSVVYLPGIL